MASTFEMSKIDSSRWRLFADAIERAVNPIVALFSRGSIAKAADSPPLVCAARDGRLETVRMLLDAGANVDEVDSSGMTACQAAVRNGHIDVLALLLSFGPNLAIAVSGERTAFDIAVQRRNDRAMLILVEAGAPLDSVPPGRLAVAAALNPTLTRALIDRGVAVGALCDSFGLTPLHWAFDPAVLDLLVNECGMDIHVRDSLGTTCCHAAAFRGVRQQMSWLIEAGADIEAADNVGTTPLLDACYHDRLDCILLLLAAGANVHARDRYGRTVCHWPHATPVGRETLCVLLAAGADLDAPTISECVTARDIMATRGWTFDRDMIDNARRRIEKARIDFVRSRAFEVCVGLQSCGIDALQMCEILLHSCGRMASLIPFHHWWKIATTVKHFR